MNKRAGLFWLLVTLPPTVLSATVYVDEAAYLAALAAGGYGSLHEGFEDDTAWSASRSTVPDPGSTPQVNSQGVLWASNFAQNEIATGDLGGYTHDGAWGFYSIPHGDPNAESSDAVCDVPDPIPAGCFLHDGFTGTDAGAGTLYGVGGWVTGSTSGSKVGIYLDGVEVGFGDDKTVFSAYKFFGVIDPAGFNAFEYRELSGKGGQAKYIFADDFTLATAVTPVPLPAPLPLLGLGLLGLFSMSARGRSV